jgi:hypothetical protein
MACREAKRVSFNCRVVKSLSKGSSRQKRLALPRDILLSLTKAQTRSFMSSHSGPPPNASKGVRFAFLTFNVLRHSVLLAMPSSKHLLLGQMCSQSNSLVRNRSSKQIGLPEYGSDSPHSFHSIHFSISAREGSIPFERRSAAVSRRRFSCRRWSPCISSRSRFDLPTSRASSTRIRSGLP